MAGFRISHLSTTVALAALAVAGCNRTPNANQALLDYQSAAAPLPTLPATLPMTDIAAPPPAPAPAAAALPDTRPIRTVRVHDPRRGAEYAYADAASRFSDALGEAPPDYGFDYAGVQPWAWEGYDDSLVFAEPVSGGYRTYYYQPGEEQPYFVRDPYYSYGYDNGQLAVVYDAGGDIVPWEDYGPQVVYASRYLVRGRDLWRASRGDRISINVQNWTNYRINYFNQQQRWDAARSRQPLWVNYAQQDAAAQRHWQAEQARRRIDQQRFDAWQAQGFRAAPPPRAIPAQWQQASWARDPHRFTPVAATVAGGAAVAAGALIAHNAQLHRQQQQQLMQAQQANTVRLQREQALQQQQQRAFAAREQAQARSFQAGQQREMQQQAALARQQQAQAARQQQNERILAQRQQAQANAQRAQQARTERVAIQREQQAARIQQQQQRVAAQREQQAARAQQQQQRLVAQREQQAARAQRDQQVRSERVTMQREQQAARMQQQQERAAAQREQQAARAEREQQMRAERATAQREQQQARIERANVQREQQAARAEQQQARAQEMAQRRQQAEAARAQQTQARAVQHAESRPAPRPEPQRTGQIGRAHV